MQDRDSFYYRAIRTKLGDALRGQYDLKEPPPPGATGKIEAKNLDLDDPEQRRRFEAAER